jgi:hypothetical protein
VWHISTSRYFAVKKTRKVELFSYLGVFESPFGILTPPGSECNPACAATANCCATMALMPLALAWRITERALVPNTQSPGPPSSAVLAAAAVTVAEVAAAAAAATSAVAAETAAAAAASAAVVSAAAAVTVAAAAMAASMSFLHQGLAIVQFNA